MAGLKLVSQIDEAELTVRMMEAALQQHRPGGLTATEVLSLSDHSEWQRAARAAMLYWRECIQRAQQPS